MKFFHKKKKEKRKKKKKKSTVNFKPQRENKEAFLKIRQMKDLWRVFAGMHFEKFFTIDLLGGKERRRRRRRRRSRRRRRRLPQL